ncbi:carotenoid biosynthesis protein [bacterium]|nr:carotenoid biosynthesis protein [bacterium]
MELNNTDGPTFSLGVVITAVLVILLMVGDRVLQEFGVSLGAVYIAVELFSGLTGVVVHSLLTGGVKWTLFFAITTMSIPYLNEIIGHKTGFPSGRYQYRGDVGAMLPGGVPLAVIFMWWMLLYASLIATHAVLIVFSLPGNPLLIAVLTAIFAAGWDLLADPVAVDSKLWEWEKKGKWMGIPLSNYASWMLTGTVTIFVMQMVSGSMDGLENHSAWIVYLPLPGYAGLHLYFAGACAKRKLAPEATWVGIIQALFLIVLYILVINR